MATAQDIIDSALRLLNVLASGETPTATERADGLIVFNQLISSWSSSGIAIPYVTDDGHTLTGAANYTIGTGSAINTVRPLVIRAMSILANNVKEDIEVVTVDEWAKIKDFTRGGKFAEKAFFSPSTPTVGVIYLWPTPASGGLLQISSLKPLTQFGSLAGTVNFPEGYERALRAALALELAPEYGAPVTETLVMNAKEAKASIVELNAAVLGLPKSQAQEPVAETK